MYALWVHVPWVTTNFPSLLHTQTCVVCVGVCVHYRVDLDIEGKGQGCFSFSCLLCFKPIDHMQAHPSSPGAVLFNSSKATPHSPIDNCQEWLGSLQRASPFIYPLGSSYGCSSLEQSKPTRFQLNLFFVVYWWTGVAEPIDGLVWSRTEDFCIAWDLSNLKQSTQEIPMATFSLEAHRLHSLQLPWHLLHSLDLCWLKVFSLNWCMSRISWEVFSPGSCSGFLVLCHVCNRPLALSG